MKHLLNWLLPNLCLWCLQPMAAKDHQLCAHCIAALPRLSLQHDQLARSRIGYRLPQLYIDGLLSLSWYQLPWSHWIVAWKFQRDLAAGEALCQRFAAACQHWAALGLEADAVCYVPMTRWRQWQRGFNQAQQLADIAAKQLQLPLWHGLRNSTHSHQVGQTGLMRRAQTNRFSRDGSIVPRTVLLVDDVITTGSTCNQIAELLKAAGCTSIIVLTLAITPPPEGIA